jgi:outer membrane protein
MDLIFTPLREASMKIINSLITLGFLLGTQQAYATDKYDEPELSWGVGLGMISEDEGYTEVGSDSTAVPIFIINYGKFYLMGPKFGYQLYANDNYTFGLTGNFRMDGYEAEDSLFLMGMDDRDGTLDLGVEYSYDTGFGKIGIEIVADTLGKHEGYQADISFSYPINFDNGQLSPYIGAEYRSDDLVNYYYGVKNTEVTQIRQFYQADSAVNLVMGIRSTWFSGPHHRFVAMLQFKAFDDSIKDSPIIDADDADDAYNMIFGYAYVF